MKKEGENKRPEGGSEVESRKRNHFLKPPGRRGRESDKLELGGFVRRNRRNEEKKISLSDGSNER